MRRTGIGLVLGLATVAMLPAAANGATITVAVTDDAQNNSFRSRPRRARPASRAAALKKCKKKRSKKARKKCRATAALLPI